MWGWRDDVIVKIICCFAEDQSSVSGTHMGQFTKVYDFNSRRSYTLSGLHVELHTYVNTYSYTSKHTHTNKNKSKNREERKVSLLLP